MLFVCCVVEQEEEEEAVLHNGCAFLMHVYSSKEGMSRSVLIFFMQEKAAFPSPASLRTLLIIKSALPLFCQLWLYMEKEEEETGMSVGGMQERSVA